MLRKAILLTAAVCLTMKGHAQIAQHWTLKQCGARYGKAYPAPSERSGLSEKHVFHTSIRGVKVNLYVDAAYEEYDGTVWRIQYVNTSGKPFPSTFELQLMQDNFPGLTWTPNGAPQRYTLDFNQSNSGIWSRDPDVPEIEADEAGDTITIGWRTFPL